MSKIVDLNNRYSQAILISPETLPQEQRLHKDFSVVHRRGRAEGMICSAVVQILSVCAC